MGALHPSPILYVSLALSSLLLWLLLISAIVLLTPMLLGGKIGLLNDATALQLQHVPSLAA